MSALPQSPREPSPWLGAVALSLVALAGCGATPASRSHDDQHDDATSEELSAA